MEPYSGRDIALNFVMDEGTERVQLRVLDVAVPDQGPAVIR